MPPTKTSKIVKAEPPALREQPYDWAAIAAKLQASPGEWFRIFENDKTGYAVSIRNGHTKDLRPSDGFEVRTSNNKREQRATATTPATPRTCDLFMRYVAPKKTRKKAE